MKSRDFCYWLQGYFELSAPCNSLATDLSVEQSGIVRQHLNMVLIHEGPQANPFCHWLHGFFQGIVGQRASEEQVALIQRRLTDVFVHEIDPSFPAKQQADLVTAHGKGAGEFLMNC